MFGLSKLALAALLALCAPCCHGSRLKALAASTSEAGMTTRAKLHRMVKEMLGKKQMSLKRIERKMRGRMSLKDALPQVEGKLPEDVMAMLKLSTQKGKHVSKKAFSETSLEKARVYLNNMMYDGWLSLAQVEVECKEFYDSNRATFGQVVTDLANLGSDLANAERLKVEGEGCIGDTDTRILDMESNLHRMKRSFQSTREKNAEELSLRQDDQDVFTAILQISKCPNESPDNSYSLLQAKAKAPAKIQFCNTENGTEVVVGDPALAEKIDKSPRVREVLQGLLRNVPQDQQGVPGAAPSFLQTGQAPQAEAVQKTGGAWNKCTNGAEVNCGYLHDIMALEWGKFKDLVDELTYLMQRNRDKYEGEKENMNEQISTLRSSKMKCQEMLGESTSMINTLTAASSEKEEQHRDLEEAYKFKEGNCDGRVADILGNICGTRTVRNNLMKYSTVSPTSSITDCDFTDWSAGPCTTDGRGNSRPIDCDDSCPNDVGGVDVNTCGGIAMLTREVITPPNQYGMACPPMFFERTNGSAGIKCNQFKCPVHCQMSMWSGWSACSKECGSGTQGKTRSILVKNKNGGTECDTTMEEQPCHTESCDRDCTLEPWTDWEPCSMACGGGLKKRVRKVDIPIRANGKCPTPENPERLQWDSCNTQDCEGDEVCIAKQDLVLAIDGSGSLKQEGFDAVKKFALNLTARYQNTYYGVEDMRVGLVLFGNGEYQDDGTITAALQVAPITDDIASISTAIEGLLWQRGFTNMMQAFSTAEVMFQEGRKEAQSAIIMISDGKYTNAYRTSMKAQEMKDAGVQIFMAPIAEHMTPNLQNIKKWASSPWETNYERIPGIDALENNEDKFAQKLLVKFCPRAFSPSLRKAREQQVGFLKVHEAGYPSWTCGPWKWAGWFRSVEACMEKVKTMGDLAFSYLDWGWWSGVCFSAGIDVTQELWNDALDDRVNVSCPGGYWVRYYYASTWMLNPAQFGSLFAEGF